MIYRFDDISIALIFGVERKKKKKEEKKKKEQVFCLVTFASYSVGIGKCVSKSFSITYTRTFTSLFFLSRDLKNWFMMDLHGEENNTIFFARFIPRGFFTRDIFMADWEGYGYFLFFFSFRFRFRCGIIFLFPFSLFTRTINVIKRNRKIKTFHLVEKKKIFLVESFYIIRLKVNIRYLFEIIHPYNNLFYVWY